jgi:hypothetical protein
MSAKGTAARRQTTNDFRRHSGGALDTVPVLRVFFKSAKGTAAHRQTTNDFRRRSGGALDTVPVLRVFFKSAKGTARTAKQRTTSAVRAGRLTPCPSCASSSNPQRARLRTAKQPTTSAAVRAGRSTPCPSCASSSNPQRARLLSLTEGPLLSSIGGPTFLIPGTIAPDSHSVTAVADSLLGPAPGPGPAQSGALVTLQVQAQTNGSAAIQIENVIALDSNLNDIGPIIQNGALVVLSPEPATGSLLLAAGFLVLAAGTQFRRPRRRSVF